MLRPVRALCSLTVFLAAALSLPATGAAEPIDHYVLALSWSPTFCETADLDRERLQCDPSADHTFIIHGLWPNTAGEAPAFCSRKHGPSRQTIRGMLDIMPSPGLIAHQWRKHGTCSAMDPSDYFATVRRAFESVTIPSGLATLREDLDVAPGVLREAFLRTNPGLREDGIYVRCQDNQLVDVRICLTRDLAFRDCPGVARRRCRSPLLDVPAPE
jgi:ribonuclease T2